MKLQKQLFKFRIYLINFKSDVICYDYSGYGKSEGNSSEKEILSDIEEVLDFVNQYYVVPTDKIILYF